MYTLEMSIINSDENSTREFTDAATSFLENLHSIDKLQVTAPTEKVHGTRGGITLMSGIIMTAISTGAFMAVYTMAKDLFMIYANAEVELKTEKGSIKLKHLTRREAEAILKEHLENTNTDPDENSEIIDDNINDDVEDSAT